MSLLLRFSSEDLLYCRFAISPLNEMADALRSLARPELAECLGPDWDAHLPGTDPAAVRDQLADMLWRAWSALIEPWWPRLRDVLDSDITYRARRLADAGVDAVLSELDPKVSWKDGAIRFGVSGSQEIDVSGTGLVLIPSVFIWPGAAVSFDPPAVIYPARGVYGWRSRSQPRQPGWPPEPGYR